MATPRTTAHTLTDVARQLAPHLRIISSSQPAPTLRTHNVIALADTPELGRRAVLALEPIEHTDEHLGTVVMGATDPDGHHSHRRTDRFGHDRPGPDPAGPDPAGPDPEGVTREFAPRVIAGALLGGAIGAIVIGAGAFLLGASGWEIVGAAAAGAMLVSVFGGIWLTFAGMGGSDAYRQTFAPEASTHLTLVSVHTDDPDEAASAHDRLRKTKLRVLDVDRFGHVSGP